VIHSLLRSGQSDVDMLSPDATLRKLINIGN